MNGCGRRAVKGPSEDEKRKSRKNKKYFWCKRIYWKNWRSSVMFLHKSSREAKREEDEKWDTALKWLCDDLHEIKRRKSDWNAKVFISHRTKQSYWKLKKRLLNPAISMGENILYFEKKILHFEVKRKIARFVLVGKKKLQDR